MTRSVAWGITLITLLAAAALAGGRPSAPAPTDPKRAERQGDLARCRALGEAAARDARCQAAWSAARARFFGRAGS